MQKPLKQIATLQQRLTREAEMARARATSMPLGKERNAELLKARQAETASQIDQWLSVPAARAPK